MNIGVEEAPIESLPKIASSLWLRRILSIRVSPGIAAEVVTKAIESGTRKLIITIKKTWNKDGYHSPSLHTAFFQIDLELRVDLFFMRSGSYSSVKDFNVNVECSFHIVRQNLWKDSWLIPRSQRFFFGRRRKMSKLAYELKKKSLETYYDGIW